MTMNERKQKKGDDCDDEESEYEEEYESEQESGVGKHEKAANGGKEEGEDESPLIDYFFKIESGHKDFVRSMIQTNNDTTLITASEDKTIKIFTLAS